VTCVTRQNSSTFGKLGEYLPYRWQTLSSPIYYSNMAVLAVSLSLRTSYNQTTDGAKKLSESLLPPFLEGTADKPFHRSTKKSQLHSSTHVPFFLSPRDPKLYIEDNISLAQSISRIAASIIETRISPTPIQSLLEQSFPATQNKT
jgi:hypothetical protein